MQLHIGNIYFVFDIQELLTPPSNNIFQQNLAITFAIYCKLSIQKFTQIRSDMTFLLYDVWRVTFSQTVYFYHYHYSQHVHNIKDKCITIVECSEKSDS